MQPTPASPSALTPPPSSPISKPLPAATIEHQRFLTWQEAQKFRASLPSAVDYRILLCMAQSGKEPTFALEHARANDSVHFLDEALSIGGREYIKVPVSLGGESELDVGLVVRYKLNPKPLPRTGIQEKKAEAKTKKRKQMDTRGKKDTDTDTPKQLYNKLARRYSKPHHILYNIPGDLNILADSGGDEDPALDVPESILDLLPEILEADSRKRGEFLRGLGVAKKRD